MSIKRLIRMILELLGLRDRDRDLPPPSPGPPPPPASPPPLDDTGPLVVLGGGFVLPTGKPIFLAGGSTGWEIQDGDYWEPTPGPFDWWLWLEDLERWGWNHCRVWMAEHTAFDLGAPRYKRPGYPYPWLRTGPRSAADGQPKFDLLSFDPEYFARLRHRCAVLQARGIYASVMLFQGVSLWTEQTNQRHKLPHWQTLIWNQSNSLNGWPLAEPGWEAHRRTEGPIWDAQLLYVRQVVSALRGLPNLLIEVANEDRHGTIEWQRGIAEECKRAMAELLDHAPWPVGISFRQGDGDNHELCGGPHDWYSPKVPRGSLAEPPCSDQYKASLLSDDHFHVYTTDQRYPSLARDLGHAGYEHLMPSARYFHRKTERALDLIARHEPMAVAVGRAAGLSF